MVFNVLKDICKNINKCLGGVNTIEPVINENNEIRLIDQTPIPGIKKIAEYYDFKIYKKNPTILQIYGYNGEEGEKSKSNFIHKAGITTEINKDFASMIAIGATANGSIPGFEATAFSKWNFGIHDRFKNNTIDAVAESSTTLEDQNQNVKSTYANFASSQSQKLGINPTKELVPEYITLNLTAITNFYRYAIAFYSNKDKKGKSSTGTGFLPFNLKLTMDGLSGIKIYNKVEVDTSFLPSNYGNTLSFLVTGVNHSIKKNQWVTNLKTLATSQGQFDSKITETVNTYDVMGAFGNDYISTDPTITLNFDDTLEYGTLGTQTTTITNRNAYKNGSQLLTAIQPGLDAIKKGYGTYSTFTRSDGTIMTRYTENTDALSQKYILLRQRIIAIAASYVGQEGDGRVQIEGRSQSPETVGTGGYPAWRMLDPRFDEKLRARGGGWPRGYDAEDNPNGGAHWCNQFCNTVWSEAYGEGTEALAHNAGIGTETIPQVWCVDMSSHFTGNYAISSNSRIQRPFQPKKISEGNYQSREIYDYKFAYGLNTPNPGRTEQSFINVNQFVRIDGNFTDMWTKIHNNEILPGDLIIYNRKNHWVDGYKFNDHIGIYIGINVDNQSIVTIEGNIGHDHSDNYTRKSSAVRRKIVTNSTGYDNVKDDVIGFCKVFLNEDPAWVLPSLPTSPPATVKTGIVYPT